MCYCVIIIIINIDALKEVQQNVSERFSRKSRPCLYGES